MENKLNSNSVKNKVRHLIMVINGDSKSKAEAAEEQLISICKPIVDKISTIQDKYSYGNLVYSGYDPTKGTLGLVECCDKDITLSYYDRWGYGGYCHEHFDFKFEWFNKGFLEELERKAIKYQITYLQKDKTRLEARVVEDTLKLKKLYSLL